MPDKARNILKDVPEENIFILSNGDRIRNLKELRDSLKIMYAGVFEHHVTDDRNDFLNWIKDVVKDNDLAKKLAHVNKKKDMFVIIANRIEELKYSLDKHYHEEMRKIAKAPKKYFKKEKENHEPKHHQIHKRDHYIENKHPDSFYLHKENEMRKEFKTIVVKEFFYGMSAGIILSLILIRILQLFS